MGNNKRKTANFVIDPTLERLNKGGKKGEILPVGLTEGESFESRGQGGPEYL